jgi:hypothetical protein
MDEVEDGVVSMGRRRIIVAVCGVVVTRRLYLDCIINWFFPMVEGDNEHSGGRECVRTACRVVYEE